MPATDDVMDDLPAEFTEGLRRVAENQVTGTRPWPGVDRAVKRHRRRRIASAVASVAAVLVIGTGTATVLGAGPFADGKHSTQSPTVVDAAGQSLDQGTKIPADLAAAGLIGPIGGSLANDQGFLNEVRARTTVLANDHVPSSSGHVFAGDVLVLWAGDVGAQRHAWVAYRVVGPDAGPEARLRVVLFSGPRGTAGTKLTEDDSAGVTDLNADRLDATVSVVLPATGSTAARTLLVLAPKARSVQVMTGHRLSPEGRQSNAGTALRQDGGMVWTTVISPEVAQLGQIQVDGEPETLNTQSLAPPTDLEQSATAIAAPKTNTRDLSEALSALTPFGLSGQETPTLAATWADAKNRLTAVVLRVPGGGHVAGVKITSLTDSSSVAAYAIADRGATSEDQFGLTINLGELSWDPGRTALAVLTPANAVEVSYGTDQSTSVTNRVGLLQVPAPAGADDQTRFQVDLQGTGGAQLPPIHSVPMLYPVYGGS